MAPHAAGSPQRLFITALMPLHLKGNTSYTFSYTLPAWPTCGPIHLRKWNSLCTAREISFNQRCPRGQAKPLIWLCAAQPRGWFGTVLPPNAALHAAAWSARGCQPTKTNHDLTCCHL